MIPKNKKIAIIHPSVTTVGWAVKMMIFLWNFLKQKWNDVCFFTTSYDKKNFEGQISFQIKTETKIKISYKIRKFDYIFVWNSPMQFVWVFSKIFFFSKAKIIWWHHHYPWYYWKNEGFNIILKKYLEKFCLKFIDLLIWNSFYIQKSLFEIYGKKTLILNPVVDEDFLIYNKYNFSTSKQKTIISYSRWVKWKNAKQIFETYEFLKDKIQDLKLLIWWEWEELEFYKIKYKGEKNIEFLWKLNKKSIIYNLEKSDLFLFSSKIDSFGISALESIFVGVPVVAFDKKWVTEIIKNWKNWFLVSNSDEFNLKVFEILNNSSLNLSLKQWCIETKSDFNYLRFEKQLNDIFLKLRE